MTLPEVDFSEIPAPLEFNTKEQGLLSAILDGAISEVKNLLSAKEIKEMTFTCYSWNLCHLGAYFGSYDCVEYAIRSGGLVLSNQKDNVYFAFEISLLICAIRDGFYRLEWGNSSASRSLPKERPGLLTFAAIRGQIDSQEQRMQLDDDMILIFLLHIGSFS